MKLTILAITIISIALLQAGCVSTGDIKGIVDKSGKAVGTVLITKAGSTLADSVKIKSKTIASIRDDTLKSKTLIATGKNRYWVGSNHSTIFWLFMIVMGMIVRYFYPKKKTTIISG